MPRLSSFNLGLYQKKFSSTSRVTGGAINIGCTKGRGSSTRIYNFLNQHPLTSATSVTSSTPVIPSNPSLSAPTISSTTPDLTTIAVFFNIPTNNGGSAITDYQYSINNGVTFVSSGTTTSPITITNLSQGTEYQIIIRAVNINGYGANSSMVEETTEEQMQVIITPLPLDPIEETTPP